MSTRRRTSPWQFRSKIICDKRVSSPTLALFENPNIRVKPVFQHFEDIGRECFAPLCCLWRCFLSLVVSTAGFFSVRGFFFLDAGFVNDNIEVK
jgi:hypothetical protein